MNTLYGTGVHCLKDKDVINADNWKTVGSKFISWTSQFDNKWIYFVFHEF